MDSENLGGCIFIARGETTPCGAPIEARGLCSRHRGLYRRIIERTAADPHPVTWERLERQGRALPPAKPGPKSDTLDALQADVEAEMEAETA